MAGAASTRTPWLARHRTRLLDTMAERQLAGTASPEPRHGLARGAIWLLALPMNLLTTAFLALGVTALVAGPTGVRVLGILALIAFLATAPRPDRRGLGGLTRADAPALFALLDRVADHTGTASPVRVQVDTRFNCAVTLVRRRPVLVLGAPLWLALPHQGRLAVLGHELGHLAHRDLMVSRWPSWARASARQWYAVGRTSGALNRRSGRSESLGGLGAVGTVVLLGAFRAVAGGYLWTLDVVNAAALRRREYLADRDAVTIGGSEGAAAMFDTLLAREAVTAAMTRAAIDPLRPDLWTAVGAATAGDSADTRQRRRAAAGLGANRVDDSHPRTDLRIRMVEMLGHVRPAVVPGPETWERIERELTPTLTALSTRARDDVRYGRR